MSIFIHYRGNSWLNEKTDTEWFGIEARFDDQDKWMNVLRDGKACVYETATERDSVMADCVKRNEEKFYGR